VNPVHPRVAHLQAAVGDWLADIIVAIDNRHFRSIDTAENAIGHANLIGEDICAVGHPDRLPVSRHGDRIAGYYSPRSPNL